MPDLIFKELFKGVHCYTHHRGLLSFTAGVLWPTHQKMQIPNRTTNIKSKFTYLRGDSASRFSLLEV